VKDPNAVKNVLNRLKASGNEIKGLMTWSVNWDAGPIQMAKNIIILL